VAAVAGISIGLSAGASSPGAAASNLAAISHASAAGRLGAAGRADTWGVTAAHGTAPAKPATPAKPAAAQAPHRPAARPVLAARQRPPAQPVVQHPAKPAQPPQRPAAPAPPAAPYLIYDSVIPTAIPGNSMIATYATGPYAATPAEVAGRSVMWIDVYGTDYNASALDVEPSDATPALAASWAYNRLKEYPNQLAHIYTSISEWPSVQQACASLPAWMQARIRWWIADPTGVPHVVPGSQATQWYWGQDYDISTALPNF
jgi:hypothetical protein